MRIDDYDDIAFLSFPRRFCIFISISTSVSIRNLNDCLICAHLWAVKAAQRHKMVVAPKRNGR